jgi:hypothetical protein
MADLYSSLGSALERMRAPREGQKRSPRLSFDATLRAAGCRLTRAQFYDLADEVREALYPDWTQDELACHPHDALQFCEVVRVKAGAPVPDNMVMKALLNRRKRK